MKRWKKLLLIGALVIVVVLLWWWMHPVQNPVSLLAAGKSSPSAQASVISSESVPVQDQTERRKTAVENILNVLGTSITFYGKVVDQNGDPVPDANVQYGAIDKFDADGSHYDGKADANGYFSISGIKGAVLTVGVWKDGYYNINDKSDGAFAYGAGVDPTRKVPPKKENPAVFVLRKMGKTEPLFHTDSRQYKVQKDGTPMEVNLETGQQVGAGQGNICFERFADDANKDSRGRFDWNFKISVLNGGIIERIGEFDFEAPGSEYKPNAEISMPASLGDKWQYTVKKSYFVKLSDGRFARLNVTIYGGHNNSLVLESFLNPIPGDRNLEFDPAKVVTSP